MKVPGHFQPDRNAAFGNADHDGLFFAVRLECLREFSACVCSIVKHGCLTRMILCRERRTRRHYYFHSGGGAYHTRFDSWEFERGQEGDVWRPLVKQPPVKSTRGKAGGRGAYWRNRAMMDPENELDYSTPRSFQRAIEFLNSNHADDDWHLHLEVFDPHEPFD